MPNKTVCFHNGGRSCKGRAEQIKELEKRKKRAEKTVEKAEKKIGKADTSIDQATGDIPRNERMQEKVREQIAAQDAVYQKYAEKLKKIRAY